MMVVSVSSMANSYGNPLQPSSSAIAISDSKSSASVGSVSGGDGGNGGYSKIHYSQEKPAASSSPAASSNTTAECRYLEQWALSITLINGSSTKMLRDLVCTLGKELNPLQKLALCIESGDYRELRYYISTLPPENGVAQEKACPVGGSSRIMSK